MGRLYSGNLAQYKDATERLKEDHDVGVVVETFRYENCAQNRWVSGEALLVVLQSGFVLTAKSFDQSDEDMRCNAQTDWLRKVHSDLKHWK